MVKNYRDGEEPGSFASIPDDVVFRYFMSELATSRDNGAVVIDAKWAFLQSPVKLPQDPTGRLDGKEEKQVLVDPPEGVDDGYYWDCDKAVPGLRTASRSFGEPDPTGIPRAATGLD